MHSDNQACIALSQDPTAQEDKAHQHVLSLHTRARSIQEGNGHIPTYQRYDSGHLNKALPSYCVQEMHRKSTHSMILGGY